MNSEIASSHPAAHQLVDTFSRSISYLRLSLTDRCNLRCMYCVTEEESNQCPPKLQHHDLLSYEELLRVVGVAVEMGITKLRLTGGEPLLRRGVIDFIRQLGALDKLTDIRLTTNGVLLEKYAADLLAAGVSKVNVSLDTLQPRRFAKITGVDCHRQVWRGIEKALEVGFASVKINVVAMRHINDDEIKDFVRLSRTMPLQIRFIEFMPIGRSTRWNDETFISADEIRTRLAQFGELLSLERRLSDGPAQVFRLGEDALGSIGFISPVSHHFCDECNRLRLTSAGALRSCLLHDDEIDLKAILRGGCDDQGISQAFLDAIRNKPKGHQLEERLRDSGANCHGQMSRIGG
ncbi:GTP 3',8-cyclase MoaA [Desulfogranum mediterraneum]|uniref:GTP 3',8-cyclase MoaA n=1 Tax=Desulfogranum mediterraneum TaxID=160661 RepID=UPI00040C7743|nr:GTP 3',8-cyclase MoaA [Desulfogranum mediterraneum]